MSEQTAVFVPKEWTKALALIRRLQQTRKRKFSVEVRGSGPYCEGDRCVVVVTIYIGKTQITYENETGKMVDSNYPYGLDFIEFLEENGIDYELIADFHSPGVHWWRIQIEPGESK